MARHVFWNQKVRKSKSNEKISDAKKKKHEQNVSKAFWRNSKQQAGPSAAACFRRWDPGFFCSGGAHPKHRGGHTVHRRPNRCSIAELLVAAQGFFQKVLKSCRVFSKKFQKVWTKDVVPFKTNGCALKCSVLPRTLPSKSTARGLATLFDKLREVCWMINLNLLGKNHRHCKEF